MILLTLIIAHLVADFYCQTDKMVRDKRKYLKLHLMHHAVVTFSALLILFTLNNGVFSRMLLQAVLPTICVVVVYILMEMIRIPTVKGTEVVKEIGKLTQLKIVSSILGIFLTLFALENSICLQILLQAFLPTVCIVLLHFFIDILKIKLTNKSKEMYIKNPWDVGLFIIDQILHVLSILFVCYLIFNINLSDLINKILILVHLVPGDKPTISPIDTIMFLIVMLIITTTVSGHIIRLLLGALPNHLALFEGKYALKDDLNVDGILKNDNGKASMSEEYSYLVVKGQNFSRGKMIGYIERILVIVLVFNNQYTAITFILTAKSLARFKQMDDRDWAEYFLLGTLVSIMLGIIYGIIINFVLK
ncbi:DUF3307 domain-containing protein [Bacillus sp. NPDC060175]|uniref:DUF3307 domain-containing protein n=1 Tax=Bacillus sp. NPDC060175 TaxID=3347061 RepID=UPI00365A4A4A